MVAAAKSMARSPAEIAQTNRQSFIEGVTRAKRRVDGTH
jgi:hypothetical protein